MVGSVCSGCADPAWHALVVRRPLMVGPAPAVLGLPPGGACPRGEKSFENLYDCLEKFGKLPCPALEAALHAQPIILYIAVRFGFV